MTAIQEAQLKELTAFYKHNLGDDYNEKKIYQVKELVQSRYENLPVTSEKFKEDSPKLKLADCLKIAEEYNNSVTKFYGEVGRIIGIDQYIKVFEAPPEEPVILVNPEILASTVDEL